MTGKLTGKIAVVTGGSAGIGFGIAEHFAQEGARVFITGRHQTELDKAVSTIGGDAAALRGDTTNLADLDRIYATVKAQAGHIDVLAANAGVYEFAALGEITEEHFDSAGKTRRFTTSVQSIGGFDRLLWPSARFAVAQDARRRDPGAITTGNPGNVG